MARARFIGPDHFGGLLALILLSIVLAPIIAGRGADAAVAGLLTGLLLLGALVASGTPQRIVLPATGLAVVLVTLVAGGSLAADTPLPSWAGVILSAMLVATPLLVLRRVLHHPEVTLSTVAGALCAYLLFGIAFSSLYRTIAAFDADAFSPALGRAAVYFSFVTLTTLGYGDVVAVSDVARTCAILEAVIGQVVLVTLVARFVGTLGQQRVAPGPAGSPRQGEAGEAAPS